MGSMVSRVPADIGGEKNSHRHALPPLLMFPRPRSDLDACLAALTQEGLWMTGSDGDWIERETRNGVRCELLTVAGTEIEVVRHVANFAADAELVFDLYNRLNYTNIVDAYTFLVDMVELVDLSGMECDAFLSWAHVVWTVDKMPFPLCAIRDFVTLDLVSKRDLLLVSRSVVHPNRAATKAPGWSSVCGGNKDSPTYRVPLLYCLKVTAKQGGGCMVTQVQWSDVGGVVPPRQIAKHVVKFGFENLERYSEMVSAAKEQKLALGPDSYGYLANPMLPRWRSTPNEMVPGIAPTGDMVVTTTTMT